MATSSPYPTYDTGALITLSSTLAGTINSGDQDNNFGRGVIVVPALTVNAGNITVNVQGKDQASGAYYTLLTSGPITSSGNTTLTVYPGAPVTSDVSANAPLPATWRAQVVIGSTGNISGTVGASVIE